MITGILLTIVGLVYILTQFIHLHWTRYYGCMIAIILIQIGAVMISLYYFPKSAEIEHPSNLKCYITDVSKIIKIKCE